VDAYGTARAAAGYLDGISSWVAGTANLGGYLSGEIEATLRILRPTSGHQIVKLDEAHRLNASSALSAIGPVYFAAVKLGVEFGINTLAEAKHLRESLALRPQKLVTR
jgi:hypothetical protein